MKKFVLIIFSLFVIVVVGKMFNRKAMTPNSTASFAAPSSVVIKDWPPKDGEAPAPVANLTASNYYVILDASGSMNEAACQGGGTKMELARTALASFVSSMRPNANLGLLVFDERGVREVVPLATDNRQAFIQAVQETRASGSTPIRSSITMAVRNIGEEARRQMGYGEYNLVVVTDGEADQGEDPTSIVGEILGKTPVLIHTIGFCIGENHSLNQKGKTFYKSADNIQELKAGLADVLAEATNYDVSKF
jgi:Ca-activated chloride channel homolog